MKSNKIYEGNGKLMEHKSYFIKIYELTQIES